MIPGAYDRIKFRAPGFSDKYYLDLLLPGMEKIVSGINHDEILNKHQTLVAATFLLTNPNLLAFTIKAMNWEPPSGEKINGHGVESPLLGLDLLSRGIRHALARNISGRIILDHYTHQFVNGSPSLDNFLPRRMLGNRDRTNRIQMSGPANSHFDTEIIDHSWKDIEPSHLLQGMIRRNLHQIGDGIPHNPINLFRFHDHRKGMVFDFPNESVMLFQTFNFDAPMDLDCSLVIRNPEIIEVIKCLFNEKIPRNYQINGRNWHLYQDGSIDVDPHRPVKSSPILNRANQLIQDPETKDIIWCSQFLPDKEDLKLLDNRLNSGAINQVEVFAPHPRLWFNIYKYMGGWSSLRIAEGMRAKYGRRFNLNLTPRNYFHAKMLVINNNSLLIGSHNFNRTLVKSRTTETALEYPNMSNTTRASLTNFFNQVRTRYC
jgi:hypothetical protein